MAIEDHSEEVRRRAYLLWEREGRPSGREHEFWARASAEIEGERTMAEEPNPNRFVAR